MGLIINSFTEAGKNSSNKIQIIDEEKNVNFWLDFGINHEQYSRLFSDFIQPRKSSGMSDFIKMNLLPKVKGIYRKDFVERSGHEHTTKPSADIIFNSHAHQSQISGIPLLRSDMHIGSSHESHLLMETFQNIGRGSFEDYVLYKEAFKSIKDRLEVQRPFTLLENGDTFKIKNRMKVEAWRVDHTLPGAMAYIFHTSKGPLVYTGDFRSHGHHKEWTAEFWQRVNAIQPYAIIGDGTNFGQPRGLSENQVYERISDVIASTDQLVTAHWPASDMDRLMSFCKAAKDNGRKLAISLKQAQMIKTLWENNRDESLTIKGKYLGHGKYEQVSSLNTSATNREITSQYSPKLDDILGEDIVIFVPRKGQGGIMEDATAEEVMKDYDSWERELIVKNLADEKHPIELGTTFRKTKASKEKFAFRKNIWVNANDIRNNQGDYVVFNDNYSVINLIDIKPKNGSIAIYSRTGPSNAEDDGKNDTANNWYNYHSIPIIEAHSSGHAGGSQLLKLYQTANPTHFIQFNSQQPEVAKRMEKRGITVHLPSARYDL
jgi:ribonuclease J